MAEAAALEAAQRLRLRALVERIRLHQGRGGIFIVVVRDSATRNLVVRELTRQLPDTQFMALSPRDSDPLAGVARRIAGNQLDPELAVATVDLAGLDERRLDKTLVALNTRREFVPDKAVRILLWCGPEQLDRFAGLAKDFWSFRTMVARFGVMPDHLADKLTGQDGTGEQIRELEGLLAKSRRSRASVATVAELEFRLGDQCDRVGRPDVALKHYKTAADMLSKLDDKRNRGAALGNIGNIYSAKGEPDKALKYLEEALAIHREIGYQRGVANQLGNIGNIYSAKGEPDKALKYHEEALQIDREIGYQQGVASDLGNIGNIYSAKGEPDKAATHLLQALRVFDAIGAQDGVTKTHGNLRPLLVQLGPDRMLALCRGQGVDESEARELLRSIASKSDD